MKIINKVPVRYGRIRLPTCQEKSLTFEPGFQTVTIPCIRGIKDQKLHRIIHCYLVEKAIRKTRDLMPTARAFLCWIRWMEQNEISAFIPSVLRYKSPSYGFREYLTSAVEGNRIASSTASAYINIIRRFYTFLGESGEVCTENYFLQQEKYVGGDRRIVTSDLAIRISRKANRSLNPMNDVEQSVFSKELALESESFRLMLLLMKTSGLRLDEVLTLPAMLFNEDILACHPTSSGIVRGINIGPECGVHTKFGSQRELFILRSLYEQILDFTLTEAFERKRIKWCQLSSGKDQHEPLFIMSNGLRMSAKAFYSRWYCFRKRIAERMPDGCFNHKPHDLRATFATNFLRSALARYPDQAANALGTVKYWMGHKSENTTMKYIAFLQQNQISDAVADVMDTFLDEACDERGVEQ
ncbi:site-specific integrase [Enterobacter sp.]|uniref:site-specific integrase n=1 Tax=Enterobacter sp. TaxID=42895 RepID=UPI003D103C9A